MIAFLALTAASDLLALELVLPSSVGRSVAHTGLALSWASNWNHCCASASASTAWAKIHGSEMAAATNEQEEEPFGRRAGEPPKAIGASSQLVLRDNLTSKQRQPLPLLLLGIIPPVARTPPLARSGAQLGRSASDATGGKSH